MESREVIYNYLQTFPSDMTVGELISNIDKANNEFSETQERKIKEFREENIGKAFYYEEKDDDEVVCKYVTIVNDFKKKSFTEFCLVCDVIAISKAQIHFEKDVDVDVRAIKVARMVDKSVYDNALKNINDLINIKP